MWEIKIKQDNGRIFKITVYSTKELADTINLIVAAKWELVKVISPEEN